MESPGIIRYLGEKISKLTGNKRVTLEPAPDPQFTAAIESHSRGRLIELYTDEKQLTRLGVLGYAFSGMHRFGEDIKKTQEEFGIKSNLVQTVYTDTQSRTLELATIIAATKEMILSKVASDRRTFIEQEALLEAQRTLTKKLKEEGLSRDYRAGASEMLKRIDDSLKGKTALPEGNPT